MKKKSLLFTLLAGLVYLTFSSNTGGPAGNGTGIAIGSPGANKTSCNSAGCHTGGATNATFIDSIVVREKVGGAIVTSYIPGKAYSISINGHNANLKNKFGFQAVILKNADNANAGTITATQTNTIVRSSNSFSVIEHSAIMTGSAILRAEFDWLAPASTTGPVTLYTMLNAVNANGQNDGDEVSVGMTAVIAENTNSSVNDIDNSISLTAYPNPVNNLLKLKMENAVTGAYQINAFDLNGRLIYSNEVNMNTISQEIYISTKDWSAGIYQLQISKDGVRHAIPIVKQ